MTFEEFLEYVREHVGKKHSDKYWLAEYDNLKLKTEEHIKEEMPFLAVRATAATYYRKL